MEDIEVLNEILFDFIYETKNPCIEEFYLIDNFKSIILNNKIILTPSIYHGKIEIKKSLKHSHDFLKTLDASYADKLMANIKNNLVNFSRRGKDEFIEAYIEIDTDNNKNIISIPYNKTIEDSYAITHEQLHDTNIIPDNFNDTCDLFTEMISFLGELLQRDYFEKQINRPKDYRNNIKDSLYATRTHAISMNMELDLIKRFLDRGVITFQDLREIFRNKPISELEIMSEQLEDVISNKELNYSLSQTYIIGNVLACYLHQRILDDPKKINEFTELNKLLNVYSFENVFDYLELDIIDREFLYLTPDSYKILQKCYNNEIKRM